MTTASLIRAKLTGKVVSVCPESSDALHQSFINSEYEKEVATARDRVLRSLLASEVRINKLSKKQIENKYDTYIALTVFGDKHKN